MTEFQFENSEAADAFELMMHLFEGRIDAAGMSRLDLALRQHASVRRLYIRVAHQYCALAPLIAARGHGDRSLLLAMADGFQPDALAENLLSETMILPALRDADAEENHEQSSIDQPIPFQSAGVKNPKSGIARAGYRIAGVIVVGLLVTAVVVVSKSRREKVQLAIQQTSPAQSVIPKMIEPEPALVTITATAGIDGAGPDAVNPRTDLAPGRLLQLSGGAVELTFATGASVVVRGPAQVRVMDRNTLEIVTGSLYAHVPPPAIGFRIVAPGLGVVDRGTNFGVRVAPSGTSSEVHVFEGRVDATALDGRGNQNGSSIPLQAGDAVAHSASSPDTNLKPVRFEPIAFDRDINRIQVQVPSHGTGADVDAGLPDAQWQLISTPSAPDGKPKSAVVVLDPRPEYVPNSDKAKWISLSSHMENVSGGNYVYRTSIDLTGFDPASAVVHANFAVDDSIREIRVNGQAASLPKELTLGLDRTLARTILHQLAISNVKWHSGKNQVDIVVWNLTGDANFTGLQLGWSISAFPVVTR